MMEKFGLLGRKLGHSFSPQIHSLLGDYEYLLYEKEPEDVEAFVLNKALKGFNITIPYKETVIPFCTELSETAKKIGSVNTIIRRGDKIEGHNTDYYGFIFLLKNAGINPRGKKALILGSGGSSKTAYAALADMGAESITVISRSGKDNYDNIYLHYDAQIIINTTPVGMFPKNGEKPVELSCFKSCKGVADIIYNPAKTALLLDAERLGIKCTNGLPMLVAQAKKASEIFFSSSIDDSVIADIVEKTERQTKNIALIGMPGCGKSSVGKALADITGREFTETDLLIPESAGKSIKEIFSEDGEDEFRRIETEVLAECAKKSGAVISTGGGIVTQQRNLDLLRQNSIIIFLDREINCLPSDGRPLSQKYGVEELANARLPLYNAWCDKKYKCIGVKETAEKIKNELKL